MMMNRKTFARLLERDKGCVHCGITNDTLIPQHRANRGAGGFKAGNAASNLIVLCAEMNSKIESNAIYAQVARDWGWKISRYDDPREVPVYDFVTQSWYLLSDDWGRKVTNLTAITYER